MTKTSPFDAISPTAYSPAYLRSLTGIPYAKEIADIIGAREGLIKLLGSENYLDTMRNNFACWAELRFESLSAAVAGKKNIFELAGGFNHSRPLIFTEDSAVVYFSTDLDGIHQMRVQLMQSLVGHRPRPDLFLKPVNATSRDDVVRCAKIFIGRGDVDVLTEGCLSYMFHPDKFKVMQNVHALLSITGGSWHTSDVHTKEELAWSDALTKEYLPNFEKYVGSSFSEKAFDTLDEAEALFEKAGFKVERREQLDLVPKLRSPVPNEKVQQMLEVQHLWTMTPK